MKKLSLITLLFCSAWVQSKEYLPQSITHNKVKFIRCNDFTLRYGFIIKVAVIGWYAPECKEKSLLESNDKILRFHYFKNVKADFFKQSAEEYFFLNLDIQEHQALKGALNEFNNGYTNIKSGDFFQLIHTNKKNLSLYKNNDLLVSTDNNEIAKKYFNIWFGNKPVIAKLKKAFL